MTTKSQPVALPLPPIDEKLRARLANGAQLRAGMMEQVARGEEPQPAYRARWLQESAHEVIRLLAERGEAFNATFPDDAVSIADHLDALLSARKMLLEQAAAWKRALAEEAGSEK